MPRKSNSTPSAPRKRGRPRTVPLGAYQRSYLASAEEHGEIDRLLRRLRKRASRQITTPVEPPNGRTG